MADVGTSTRTVAELRAELDSYRTRLEEVGEERERTSRREGRGDADAKCVDAGASAASSKRRDLR